MFFLIGGIQPRTVFLEAVDQSCPVCRHSPFQKKRTDHFFSLFFIPLFRVKKGNPYFICPKCHSLINGDRPFTGIKIDREGRECPSCHGHFSREYSFCPYCGKAVE